MAKFNKERLTVSRNHYLDSGPEECQTLKDLRVWVEVQIMLYGEEAYVTLDAGYNNITSYITTHRPETDEEYEKRLAQFEKNSAKSKDAARKRKEKEAEAERKLYEKLKEKYEAGQ